MLNTNMPAIVQSFMSEAHETVQARFLGEDFVVARQTKKGAVVRSKAGVMLSGNAAERAKGAEREFLEAWCANKRPLIVNELRRVFPTLDKAIAARNAGVRSLLAEDGTLKCREIFLGDHASKQDVMAAIGIAQQIKGADKGEKAKLLNALRLINEYELEVLDVANELARIEVGAAAELTTA